MQQLFSRIQAIQLRKQGPLSTFDGVFLPTLLAILGAVMYLRTGWVVGQAGLLGAFFIIGFSHLITICTALSVASIATNTRVGAGGSFSIISQSLGLEVGGSVNLPYYFAQAIATAFYIFAFSEGWTSIFPNHPSWLVLLVTYLILISVAFNSAGIVPRLRYGILFIIVFSLLSVFLGSFAAFGNDGFVNPPQWIGEFASNQDLWSVLAIFFPAVTGILAGVNLSGSLANPRRSIPRGSITAVLVSLCIYSALAYWSSRVATPFELRVNLTIMVERAALGWAVQAGILAATFSAALSAFVGGPRVLQAMADHNIVPFSKLFNQTTERGEPRPALALTSAISLVFLLFGFFSNSGLNGIAPVMSMFYLLTYAILNLVVLLEQRLGLTSFRPTLDVPQLVPFIGVVGAIVAMVLINPLFSLVAVVVTLLLYQYLTLRQLEAPWSDVRSGMFVTLAEWAAKRVIQMPSGQIRAWKPSLLVPVQAVTELRHSYRFLEAITKPNGLLHVVGFYQSGQREQLNGLLTYEQAFSRDGIFARVALLESRHLAQTLQTAIEMASSAFFHPNTLFLPILPDSDEEMLQFVVDHAVENRLGVILYLDDPAVSLGREQTINVWLREQSPDWKIGLKLPNLDLSLLLAYQVARNWPGQINLLTAVSSPTETQNAKRYLRQLKELGRMPRTTRTWVMTGSLDDALDQAPEADLTIFGLQRKLDLAFIRRVSQEANSSCIFVRDSGMESALV